MLNSAKELACERPPDIVQFSGRRRFKHASLKSCLQSAAKAHCFAFNPLFLPNFVFFTFSPKIFLPSTVLVSVLVLKGHQHVISVEKS
jgi:hypothetical protein